MPCFFHGWSEILIVHRSVDSLDENPPEQLHTPQLSVCMDDASCPWSQIPNIIRFTRRLKSKDMSYTYQVGNIVPTSNVIIRYIYGPWLMW